MLSPELLTAPAEAVVIPMDGSVMSAAVAAATALREKGVKTQVYFEGKKFKQKIGYADKSGIPFAVLIGADEAAAGTVSVKDMASGEQQTLPPAQAAALIDEALARRRSCRVISD